MQFNENYGPMDIDIDYEYDEPVCICEEYFEAVHPAFCKACNMWTDNAELLMAESVEQAEKEAA
jgi:hypothetical protein